MDVIEFRKIVARYKGDYRVRKFKCWDQLLCMCFGQLTFRQSLRELTPTLNVFGTRCYHTGNQNEVSLSTFADANRQPRKRSGYCLLTITNCDAAQITSYYKQRWQIELFFKWIKQHL